VCGTYRHSPGAALLFLLEKRRKARLALITGSVQPGYFQLAPREDETTFQRADGKHDEVLKWLRQPSARVLYLTGSSGAGKSSLLAAWVLPKLEREGVKVVRLRGYQDPAQALEDELKRPGVVWKRNTPDTADLNLLFEEARQRLQPSRILVVFDQFEEFLILHDEKKRARFVEFLNAQAGLRESGPAVLLVFRAEYDGFIQDLGLPAPIPGQNLQKVSAFTERAAQDFLLGSQLQFHQQLLGGVLREAAEVEETKGLIRPVTLNLCGLVLSRFATGLPREFRPGRLIRGFVRESIFLRKIKEVSPVLLPKLISTQITKRPQSIAELSAGTGLTPEQVRGAMFALAEPDRGIVRPLNADYTLWEISHDFLVPMIDSILAQWRVSIWRRIRPWIPLAYVAALLLALFVAPRFFSDPVRELNNLGWETRGVNPANPDDADYVKDHVAHVFTFDSIPPRESVRALKRVREPFAVDLIRIDAFDSARFADWGRLANLRWLTLSHIGSSEMTDISALGALSSTRLTRMNFFELPVADEDLKLLPRSLTSLAIDEDSRITGTGFKDLPRSVTDLELRQDGKVTGIGLKDLPQSLNKLVLTFNDTITDQGLMELPRSLTVLDLTFDSKITDAGLRNLPRSLTDFQLGYDDKITGSGFKDLPGSLTHLDLSNNGSITDTWLMDLPRSLTRLSLSRGANISDAGLKDLPRSLTDLDLSIEPRITDAGLKDLPRSLTHLDLTYDSSITDAGLKDLPRSLTTLVLDHDDRITADGIKTLPSTTKVSGP
jgi:hypothetical protein